MQLRDFLTRKVISEGGNVSSKSPGWQGAPDQEAEEIDLKIHDRDFMVSQLRTLLSAQNESFKAAYGKYIWDPKLLASGKMFSGSSLQFFDVKGVNTQDFVNKLKKTKVGDIDTQIDQDMGDEVTAWLKSIVGKKVGNGTFLGFNSSLSSIWLLDDPQVRIQVDYELGPYDAKTKSPTEWFAYSHSSHYDDMAAGIKGVFHKYINRALTHAQSSEKYVARVLKKGVKISDAPVNDSDYSFAVSSSQGGGMSIKYKPYVDPATGQPMEKDGIPVMQLLEPKDRDYIQNLDQQFQMTYGRKRGAADKNLQGSFVGTIQLMNKSFTPEQNESVARAFLDILFGPGAQMITKDDPARDRDVKFAAVDAMLLGGNGVKPLNVPNGQGLRQNAVKMAMDYADKFNAKRGAAPNTEVAEDAAAEIAAKPNYARQGIKHMYNRLPDGRISSAEMKDADFLEIAKEIAANGGTLDGVPISLKVDGAGIRFGKDSSGRPFFMTSKVTTPLYQDDVGYFTNFGKEKGQDAAQLARTKNYDNALALITGSKFIQTLPADTIVQAEMMYNPMAEKTDQGLKFVNIPYDPAKLGGEMTLVPFVFKQYSTGEDRPDADRIKKRLLAASDSKIKIVTNQLEQKGINVSKIIDPILNLDPKVKANKPAFDKAKQELSSAIIDNPKLVGKDALGDNMEGIVVNMPNGQMFKVTSSQMKSAMAAKMAQPGAKRQGPLKTAVVAIGSFAGHLGHEDLFNATLNKAKELGGDPYLFIGNAVGADDPIPTDVKVQTWHKLYPEYANNISAVMQGGSIMQKVKHELINPQPGKPPKYDNVVIMVGEDRADMPLAGALMKAVNKFPGYEHVKVSLETIPRTRPISFTKLRDVLKNPNATPEQQYTVWAQGFNEKKLGKSWLLHLMDISREGMGVQATAPAAPQPVAERLFNALVRPRKAEPLAELFQPGKDWKWSFKGSEEAVAVFHVGEIPYQFYAYRPDENYPGWDVEFKNAQRGKDRITKFGLTGTGNSAEVMSTVADIMRAFLQEYQGKIKELTFSANESSRQALYARMAKRLLPTWNLTQDGREFKLSAPTEQGVAEGFDKEADAYKEKLLSTLPQMMRFYEKNVEGWKPSKEQMLGAIDTGYMVMKHTGDVKQAGKAMMDELNTLHRMSQGQQGVAEGLAGNDDIARLKAGDKTSDGINMQDIRLMAGEGKLTKQTVLQALAVIRKHRAERGVAEARVEINQDAPDNLYDIQDKLAMSRWKSSVKNVITSLFAKQYPGVQLFFKNTQDGNLFVTTDKTALASEDVGLYSDTDEFGASIIGPTAEYGVDDILYVGIGFDSIKSGKYKGIVGEMLNTIVPPLAAKFKAKPAIVIVVEDQSGGAWEAMANKLGWAFISGEDEQGMAEQGYGNHPSQRVDPRTGKKYVPPKSPLGQGLAEGASPFDSELTEVFNTQPPSAATWARPMGQWAGMDEFNFVASNSVAYRVDFLATEVGPDEVGPYTFFEPDDEISDQAYESARFVSFEQKSDEENANGKQGIEGTGVAAEVFGIVTNVILQYIKKAKPSMLYFQAVESNRQRLYARMAARIAQTIRWKVKQDGPAHFAIYNPRVIKVEQGVAEGAPIVVMPRSDRFGTKKPAQPYRNKGDIVPPTNPPSTEKRGVKGRPGQRPMPDHSVEEEMLPKSAFAGSDKHKLGPAAHAKGKQKGPVKKGQFVGGMEEAKKKGADGKACWKGYRYNGTENGKDKCVPVSEDVENIIGALINKILINEAISNNKL